MHFTGRLKGQESPIRLGHVVRRDDGEGTAYIRVANELIPYVCTRASVTDTVWGSLHLGSPVHFRADSFHAVTAILT
jgi:hypothetical protein